MSRNMSIPIAQISWGELIDKITILEIKLERLTLSSARDNVRKELQLLTSSNDLGISISESIIEYKNQLVIVNGSLWDIEDNIREKERLNEFDAEFIQLARSVYKMNDIRAKIKRTINEILNSEIIEEKSYKTC